MILNYLKQNKSLFFPHYQVALQERIDYVYKSLFYFRKEGEILWAGKRAQLVKYLLQKCEDPSSHPQNPCRAERRVSATPALVGRWEVEMRECLKALEIHRAWNTQGK